MTDSGLLESELRFPGARLVFYPHMTLQAAARIAHAHGCELRLQWDGKQACVTAVPTQPVREPDHELPAFLRPQAE